MKRSTAIAAALGLTAAAVLIVSCAGTGRAYAGSIAGSSGETADRKAETAKPSAAKSAAADAPAAEFAAERPAPSPAPRGSAARAGGGAPAESGLKAGWADDNAQYNLFIEFLRTHEDAGSFRAVPAEGRVLARLSDADGRGVPNAEVSLRYGNGGTETIRTYADGAFLVTPGSGTGPISAWVSSAAGAASFSVDPAGPRSVDIRLDGFRRVPAPVPLDIVFVMDTTGSMGEEIERLKATVDIIRDNLDLAAPRPEVRFGLVLYKDRGDQYITRAFPLTADLAAFRKSLAAAYADGGGDEPEDLEAALDAAVSADMGWREDGARLIFVVTDAPAQSYPDAVGYDRSAEAARRAAIKIHAVGTGGLPLEGEYQLRQIAQRTRGRYIFLTYGERGESAGGEAGAVSHHTGANWTADRLETIIIRFAKEELAFLGAEGTRTPDEDYFQAKKVGTKDRDAILDELFAQTLGRLLDYSNAALAPGAPCALLPTRPITSQPDRDAGLEDAALKANAEYFGMRLLQAASAQKRVRLVERDDLQSMLAEWELRLSAAGDADGEAELGKLLGAELLIVPKLAKRVPAADDPAGGWELSVKLVAVRTGEILSVARARIDGGLGL